MSHTNVEVTLAQPMTLFGKGDRIWCNLKRIGMLPAGTSMVVNTLTLALDYQQQIGFFHSCIAKLETGETLEGYVRSNMVSLPVPVDV